MHFLLMYLPLKRQSRLQQTTFINIFFIIFQRKYDLMFQVNPLLGQEQNLAKIINVANISGFSVLNLKVNSMNELLKHIKNNDKNC